MRTFKNIFITGRPGVGKTTAILKAVNLLGFEVNGFTTAEIREQGLRTGFAISAISGPTAIMAHVDFRSPIRVGKYRVEARAVEEVGVRALKRALERRTPAVVDEVGRMELAVPTFVETLMAGLDSELPVLGTLHKRQDAVAEAIRRRPDTVLIELTPSNRDEMPGRLSHMLSEARQRFG